MRIHFVKIALALFTAAIMLSGMSLPAVVLAAQIACDDTMAADACAEVDGSCCCETPEHAVSYAEATGQEAAGDCVCQLDTPASEDSVPYATAPNVQTTIFFDSAQATSIHFSWNDTTSQFPSQSQCSTAETPSCIRLCSLRR